jgi:hypothetical protein
MDPAVPPAASAVRRGGEWPDLAIGGTGGYDPTMDRRFGFMRPAPGEPVTKT